MLTACSGGKTTFQQPDASTSDATSSADGSNPIFDDAALVDTGSSDASPDGKPSAPNLIPNGDFEQGNTSRRRSTSPRIRNIISRRGS